MKMILSCGSYRKNLLEAYCFFTLIICICLLGAFGCKGNSATNDMDSDGIEDTSDNCPFTSNTNQLDSDGNGVGDACQGDDLSTGDNLAYKSSQGGVAEAGFDQRLRTVRIAVPGQLLTFVWADDSSQADITQESNGDVTASSSPVDFTDAALLSALDAAQEDGDNMTVYIQYVEDHPGEILKIVTGQQQPSSARKDDITYRQDVPTIDPTVNKYLLRLTEAVLICRATSWSLQAQYNQHKDPRLRDLYEGLVLHFADLAREIEDTYREQQAACIACTADCNVDCRGEPVPFDEMACCIYTPGVDDSAECLPTDQEDCKEEGGEFHEGASCDDIDCFVGACCIDLDDTNPEPPDFNQLPRCAPASSNMCDDLAYEQEGIVVQTFFYLNKECSEVICLE
jgi:hypothetical protein